MKIYLLLLLFCFTLPIVQAQQTMKINSLQEGEKQYSFSGTIDNKPIKITITKTSVASQLMPANSENVWIGKNNAYVRYFTIAITFSEVVTSASFLLSHFNNDQTGDEQISKFRVFNSQEINLTSSSTFNWLKGDASGDSSSLEAATEFDHKSKIVKASQGYGAEVASGLLVVSNNQGFTQFTFSYEVLEGTPNGFYLSGDIDISLLIPPLPLIVEEEKNIDTIEIIPPVKQEIQVAIVDSVKEEPVPAPIVKKTTPVVKKKTVTNSTPVKITPIKKTTVASTTVKKTVPLKPAAKPTVKKSTNTQTVVKKTTTPPVKVKTKTSPEKIHEIKEIKSMQVGEKVKLNKVFFKQSMAVLLPESYPQLDTLVMILKELPQLEIELQGHTDNQGEPKLNLQLSQQRVIIVKQYLVSKGISPERLTEKGFGGNRAAVPNDTEENRRKNRRVEFMITKR